MRASWLLYVLLPVHFPGLPVPELVEDLMGFKSMLRERAKKWPQEWKEEGQREFLMKQLEQKFGDLPAKRRREVASANANKLFEWGGRVLASDNLEQVFQ